ncbi:MAG: hypothetical protein M3170_04450 [Candidatus Dormibacteraeota bacterium]|nr:hypothetical protein [Candidatus Dormibacteraeota bacterium]
MAFGGFLRRQGSRREAAAQLLAARVRLLELGAEPYLERCDREVRFHLSQIFGKLDMTSRRQIAKHPHMALTA